jgi:hypothetical protein
VHALAVLAVVMDVQARASQRRRRRNRARDQHAAVDGLQVLLARPTAVLPVLQSTPRSDESAGIRRANRPGRDCICRSQSANLKFKAAKTTPKDPRLLIGQCGAGYPKCDSRQKRRGAVDESSWHGGVCTPLRQDSPPDVQGWPIKHCTVSAGARTSALVVGEANCGAG